MKTEQLHWTSDKGWTGQASLGEQANIVLVFGGVDVVHLPNIYSDLKSSYPKADVVMASTAGEIIGTRVFDGTVVATAIQIEKSKHRIYALNVQDYPGSGACGKAIREALMAPDLKHILVISDGKEVNGDALVKGINEHLPSHVVVTGGLAADAGRFTKTYVGVNEIARPGRIVAIGFYGDSFKVSHGSQGGWDEFGPIRRVTKSEGNVLFTLDGVNALEVYKKYLGEKASELPGAALLFPICILGEDGSKLVRTILSIDEAAGSMTFAGDVPTGARVQFMMANFDRLIDGATTAAESNLDLMGNHEADLVLMISCVGRKIVLAQRIEEEVETVSERFGDHPAYCGFYSNGEISPLVDHTECSLHNQTMTITSYTEA